MQHATVLAAPARAQPTSKTPAKDTAAADRTRSKLLKAPVSGDFKNVPLRDVLKEFREFAMRGNVVDLAIAVIIASFGWSVNGQTFTPRTEAATAVRWDFATATASGVPPSGWMKEAGKKKRYAYAEGFTVLRFDQEGPPRRNVTRGARTAPRARGRRASRSTTTARRGRRRR